MQNTRNIPKFLRDPQFSLVLLTTELREKLLTKIAIFKVNGTSTKVNIATLISAMPKEKQLEVAFITVFSVLILAMFYVIISMNGVVLGNDPAVHLEKAQIFLRTGEISLANLGWTPPLYQIYLQC